MNKALKENSILLLILFASLLVKNPFGVQPFLEHFGSYQSVTAMMAQEFINHDFKNLFYPTSFSLTNGQPSLILIYYPLGSLAAAAFWKIFGGSLEYWGCFQAMFFSAGATALVYLCGMQLEDRNKRYALLCSFFFAFSPMSLIYGRMFMNESAALFFVLLALYLLLIWRSNEKRIVLFASGLIFSIVIVLRLHYFVLLPGFLWLMGFQKNKGKTLNISVFGLGLFMVAAAWFLHTYLAIGRHSNLYTTVFSQTEARPFPDPLLFQWSFYQTVLKEFFLRLWGPVVFLIMLVSYRNLFNKRYLWIFWCLLVTLGLVIVSPQKYYDQSFYLLPLLPLGSFLAASAFDSCPVWKTKGKWLASILIIAVLGTNLILFWRPAFSQASDQKSFFEAVNYVKTNTLPSDKIIAVHGTSADLMYYCGRYGISFPLGVNRTVVPKYFKVKKFTALTDREIEGRNEAYRDVVKWFEYEKNESNAKYLVVMPKTDLSKDPSLERHLDKSYSKISPAPAEYVVYKLS